MSDEKASIVVLCYNGLKECTQPCVDSLLRHTPSDSCEIILVDNCSQDNTAEYIRELSAAHFHIRCIYNDNNLGYAGGNNVGIKAASHPFIVLLNNDTMVTQGWLEELLAPFAGNDSLALVGPVTNSAGNQQCISALGLDGDDWENVAAYYTALNRRRVRKCRTLGFFCVAIRSIALERAGLLDESFGLGMFEDTDLCLRMQNAGFDLAMTDGCFVRHLGSASFSRLDSDVRQALFEKNRLIFYNKHRQRWTFTGIVQDIWKALVEDIEYATCFKPESKDFFTVAKARFAAMDANVGYTVNNENNLRLSLAALANRTKTRTLDNVALRAPYYGLLRRALNKYKREGFYGVAGALKRRFKSVVPGSKLLGRFANPSRRVLKMVGSGHIRIVLMHVLSWDKDLFQRPQHLARELAALGYTYIYTDVLGENDLCNEFTNLYITPHTSFCHAPRRGDILHLYSQQHYEHDEIINKWLSQGGRILYEYIDELHPDIGGQPIPDYAFRKHRRLLEDKNVMVVATASRLYNECVMVRGSSDNIALVPNAAEVEHFTNLHRRESAPVELKNIVGKGKKILGYYGALSSWFDYELVAKLAADIPDCEIVIIGPQFGEHENTWHHFANIHNLGSIPYSRLPEYAQWFDVAMIPFKINDITLSTSPIKLFEYMALGLETVSMALPECSKYPYVLIARDHAEFVYHTRTALERAGDEALRLAINDYARANHSWAARAGEIDVLIRQ